MRGCAGGRAAAYAPAVGLVVRDVEHEPVRAVAGEEVLDRLASLAAGARRAHPCAERDQRRLQVAARRVGSPRRAEVAADRRLRRGSRGRRRARARSRAARRASSSVGDRRHRADRDPCRPRVIPVEPARSSSSARSGRSRRGQLGHRRSCRRRSPSCRPSPKSGTASSGDGRSTSAVLAILRRISVSAESNGRPRQMSIDYPGYARRVDGSSHSIDALEAALRDADYLPDRGLATALFLSLALEKPLLLEGEAGVGKTEAAKALATRARRAADPAAVLRGPRRRPRGLRVELPAPAAPHPRGAGGHGRPRTSSSGPSS